MTVQQHILSCMLAHVKWAALMHQSRSAKRFKPQCCRLECQPSVNAVGAPLQSNAMCRVLRNAESTWSYMATCARTQRSVVPSTYNQSNYTEDTWKCNPNQYSQRNKCVITAWYAYIWPLLLKVYDRNTINRRSIWVGDQANYIQKTQTNPMVLNWSVVMVWVYEISGRHILAKWYHYSIAIHC